MEPITIVGGGLAGAEVALQLADRGVPVRLFEMKPHRRTPAQTTDDFAELVCSNSFRSASLENAVGLLKEEMRIAGGQLIAIADRVRVPAGDALAVDRAAFAKAVGERLSGHPHVEVVRAEVTALPAAGAAVIATGPLTSDGLAQAIGALTGGGNGLYFYDAIAPIVLAESIDRSIAFAASRYGKGDGDEYLNCPMNREEYDAFIAQILSAEKLIPNAFEAPKFFEGCLPIEVMAERGPETLRFGCMKPVGLDDPRTGRYPYAVVQLRAENVAKTAYNLVGFQTRMKWPEQTRVFRTIPGLANAEFLRLGQIHRNTYLDAPRLLTPTMQLRAAPHLWFAGQITGVEGYVESIASGLYVGLELAARRRGRELPRPPRTTALGALLGHVLGEDKTAPDHVPSNVHFGLFPPLAGRVGKRDRRRAMSERALTDFRAWWSEVAAALDPAR